MSDAETSGIRGARKRDLALVLDQSHEHGALWRALLDVEGLEVEDVSRGASPNERVGPAVLVVLSGELTEPELLARLEWLPRLRAPDTVVLASSAVPLPERLPLLAAAGVDVVLDEELHGPLLRERIRQLLRRGRETAELRRRLAQRESECSLAGLAAWALRGAEALSLGGELRHALGLDASEASSAAAIEARIHPDDRQLLRAAIAEARRSGSTLDLSIRVRSARGDVRRVLCRGRSAAGGDLDGRLEGIAIDLGPVGASASRPAAPAVASGDPRFQQRLERAVTEELFEFHYQPKVAVHTGRVVGCEALMRWNEPTSGWISPAHFIPALEQLGLIDTVGLWSLRVVCRQVAAWRAAGLSPGHVAINISPLQFRDPELADRILESTREAGVEPADLQVEITEGCLIEDGDAVVRTLKLLREQGVGICIDDFGTGFSSLQYLAQLPIDCLKIDRAFVSPLEGDANARSLVVAIIAMAWNLGLRVVAEGVETEAQWEFLTDHGCDEIQGFYFSRPLPAGDFAALLRAQGGAAG